MTARTNDYGAGDVGWIYLLAAGLFEIGFTTAFRYTDGFSRLVPVAIFVACIIASFILFDRAVQTIPVSTAYAVWASIGAVGTVILGIVVFGEPATFWRVFFIGMLIGSIVGLKLVSS